MARVSWPYDSTLSVDGNGNPVYSNALSSDYLAMVLQKVLRNGVFMDVATSYQVLANSGMTLTLKVGAANIQGHISLNLSDSTLTIATADSQPRYDRIVLRHDANALNIYPLVIKGTPATSPVAPAQYRTSLIYDITLAYVYVGANATSISQAWITDKRASSECGIVASIIGETDFDALYAQFTNTFNTWFATAQNTLSGDAAGNLLALVQACVRYTGADNRTTAEKTQARTNMDAQKTLSSSNPLPTASGGLGATFATFAAIATAIANQLGLKSLAYNHIQAGYASITILAGQTTASLTVTYSDPFSAAPIDADCKLYGTGFPNAYGGKFASLHSTSPTATQITLAVGIGTAQSSDVSIPVRWSAIGSHS